MSTKGLVRHLSDCDPKKSEYGITLAKRVAEFCLEDLEKHVSDFALASAATRPQTRAKPSLSIVIAPPSSPSPQPSSPSPQPSSPSSPSPQTAPTRRSASPTLKTPKKVYNKKVCRKWRSHGYCSATKKCPWEHPANERAKK